MELLKQKILDSGVVLSDKILKVDSFINHQIDVKLTKEIGKEFKRRFADKKITKIVTVESSGIAPAYAAAMEIGVDLVFARKNESLTLNKESSDLIFTDIFSYTKNVSSSVYISKKYITPDDSVLIIDDFLANGEVGKGLIKIIKEAGAEIAGIGIVIEKSFQSGRAELESYDVQIESLVRLKSLADGKVEFL